MTTEAEYVAAIAASRAEYHANAEMAPAGELRAKSQEINRLSNALAALLADGANPCHACGAAPIGMLKRVAYTDGQGEHPPVYEVGCTACSTPDRSRGWTPDIAVTRWNNKEFVA